MSTPDQVSQIALGRRKLFSKEIIVLMPYWTKAKNLTGNLKILVMHLNKHLQHFVLLYYQRIMQDLFYSPAHLKTRL